MFRADIDAVGGQAGGLTTVSLVAVFGGVQDVGAYDAACLAVEPFGEAGRWGRDGDDAQGRRRAEAMAKEHRENLAIQDDDNHLNK